MVFGENNIDNFYNSQSDFFDKEDDMLNDVYRIFRDINNQNPTTIETVYTSFFNDDDEKIPDFIIAEFEDSLKEDTVTRDKPYTPQKPSQSSQINTQPIHITSTNIDHLSNRWELISIIEKIVTGLYASIYITLQKYNNNYYVVLTKISNRYNPRHCALPISVADFIADCIWDALQNKENINTQTPTSRKQWFLCKEYGTIFPHPQNYITISHQQYNSQDYIVLTKRDHHKRAKNFAFSMKYAQQAVYALKSAYDKGKTYAGKIFAITRPNVISKNPPTKKSYKSKMLKCLCGHQPELTWDMIRFINGKELWIYYGYCPQCKVTSKRVNWNKDKAIFYWNQMIRTFNRKKQNQRRSIRIKSL